MPAIATKPTAGAKFETEVERQLDKVVRRIRTHDILAGAFLLVVVALAYLATAMVLDRWLELPGWVRQLGFLGLLGAVGSIGYLAIWRPARRTVNPLYAAKEVEDNATEAKNSIVNWVDLHDKPMNESVRAAVAARAAKLLKDADLDKAGESKRLLYLGWTLGVLVVVFAALFMVFKPVVFSSLFGRAINPFSSGQIATRTQLTLLEPKGGDLTVTAGQPVTVSVEVGGKVPDADAPDRLRVLLRHNAADWNYDEVALEPGDATRLWTVRLAERHVQNGFWYKVAGGDDETPEYRVTVRPKPTFTEFDVRYEYPEYLRMKPDAVKSPHIEAHRGTVVTITAKANRTLKDGRAAIANQPVPVFGEVVGEAKDSLRVKLTLAESGSYRLLFNSTDGEANTDAPVYDLRVLSDQPPTIAIANPKDEEVILPVNGLLGIDGTVGDDFGIDKVTLRLRMLVPNLPAKNFAGKPYQGGQSFKRAADGTFPTELEYKDSVSLDRLTDEAGAPVSLKPDAVIEYWVEATDNCTVPSANVGKSKVQRIRLIAAKVEEKQKDEIKQQVEKRKQDEAAFKQEQQKKLDKEQRAPKPSPQKPNDEQPAEKPEGQPGEKTETKPGEKGTKPEDAPAKAGAETKGTDAPMPKADPKSEPGQAGEPMPMGQQADTPEKKELQRKGEEIQKKIEDEQKQSGDAKPNGQPMEQPGTAGGKKGKPMDGAAAEPKPAGDEKGSEPESKPGPLGGLAGGEKSTPKDANTGADQQAQEQAARDLAGNDEGKKQAARQELDKAIGEKGRKDLEDSIEKRKKIADGLQSNDPKEREQAEAEASKLQRELMDREQERNAKSRERQDGDAEQLSRKKELDEAIKNSNSDDPKKREEGEKKLDELVGKDARKEAAKLRDDLKSGDKDREKAAQDELKKMQKAAEQKATELKAENDDKLEKAAKDVAGNDPQKKDAAKKEIDKQLGQGAGEKAEQAANEKKGAGDKEREQAAKDELKKQQAGKGEPSPENQQKLDQAANDLAGNDPKKKEDAKKEIDKQLGQGAGEKAEKEMNARKDTGEKNADKAAQDGVKKAQKEAGKGGEPSPEEKAANQQKLDQAAKDLAGKDAAKKEAAKKEIDKQLGQGAGDKAEQNLEQRQKTADKLQSKDPKEQAEGEAEAEKLQRDITEEGLKNAKSRKSQQGDADQLKRREELEQAAKDLNSDDPMKKEAAQKKLDEMVGKDARENAEQLGNDLKSGDKDKQKAAVDELKKMQKDAEKQNAKNDAGQSPEQKAAKQEQLEKAAKDLAGNDAAKKEAAKKDLDEKLGKGAGEKLEKQLADRKEAAEKQQSKDEAEKKAGEAKAQQMQKDELEKAAAEKDRQETEQAAKDLMSDDKAKKDAARKKLEEKFGKGAVDKAEQMAQDLKSGDPKRQEAAQEELKKLQNEAEKNAKKDGPKGEKELSPEEIDQLAKAAKDLKSSDANKKKEAEKQLDDKLGEQGRKQIEDMLKDGQEPSPEQMEAAKKALEQLGKNHNDKPGLGGNVGNEGKVLDANKEFDRRAGQLQLEQLKKADANKELLKKLGYTEEEYKRFLDGYEKMVKEAPAPKDGPLGDLPKAGGPPTTRIDDASKVERRDNGSKTGTAAAGASAAPPGYGDARKKFAENATKSPKDEKK